MAARLPRVRSAQQKEGTSFPSFKPTRSSPSEVASTDLGAVPGACRGLPLGEMDARSPAGASASFNCLPFGLVQRIVQSLDAPRDQGRAACVNRACRAAAEELAPALYHFTTTNQPMKVSSCCRCGAYGTRPGHATDRTTPCHE